MSLRRLPDLRPALLPGVLLALLPILAAAPVAAQVTAVAKVHVGPNLPAPADSLRAEPVQPITYLPDAGDVVVMEVESQPAVGGWVLESSLPGFGGEGYYRWAGPNLFNSPGQGVLSFRFEIRTPGRYLVRVHVRHDHPDPSTDNDCWARLGSEPWEKLYHHGGSAGVGIWTFNPIWESTKAFPEYQLAAGVHTFQISGRSQNFKIDRVHVLPYNTWFAQLGDPESDVERMRPLLGQAIRVEVDDPTGAAGLTPGTTLTAVFLGFPPPTAPAGTLTPWGELLMAASPVPIQVDATRAWSGPGQPSVHTAQVPADAALLGRSFALQGVFLEPGNVVLTDALELIVGNQ